MEELTSFLGRTGFLPHGYCFTWSPGVLWSMVTADSVIAASYFTIPLALVRFVRKRPDFGFTGVTVLFGAFIFACGITHVMDVWTIWHPDYGLQALTKIATAAVSLVTAIALWPLIPKALKIPSVRELESVIRSLEAEAARRNDAEERLAEVEQGLAVALASIGAGFLSTDRQSRVTRINAVAERITGWTAVEAMGADLYTVFRHERRTAADAAMNPVDVVIREGFTADQAHQTVTITRGGERTPVDIHAALTRTPGGEPRGLALVFQDTSRLVAAERGAMRLAAIVESSQDAIFGKTLGGTITSWNRGAERMLGYAPDEAIGQPVQMLIPPDRQAEEMTIVARLADGETVPAFDTVRIAKDGRPVAISLAISPVRDAQGRVVGAATVACDVTEQRRAEAALRESEARLRLTLDAAEVGDWDLDLATGKARRSLRHDRCFGYETLQSEWTREISMRHVHPQDRERLETGLADAIANGHDWQAEFRVTWPDGSIHRVRSHGSVPSGDASPTHMLGIIFDVTRERLLEESRLLAQRLEAENRETQQANRLKSEFLANMSHELRTPLNAVIGFAELLKSGIVPADSPNHAEFLGHIATSGRHLLQLVNDVLDLSKVEAGKFEFFPEPVDLGEIVADVRDVLRTGLDAKSIRCEIAIEPGLTDIVVDPARLKQVLFNYLSNAIKFTPADGAITVRVASSGASRFVVEVEDSGVGIAAHDLPRLFTEFQQLDGGLNKQHQGTGLGLALVRRLVEAQGGTVSCRSTVGVGSVFAFEMARRPDDGGSDEQRSVATPHRLLVVGSRDSQDRLATSLKKIGFVLDGRPRSRDAVAHAIGNGYEAVTLSLRDPGGTLHDAPASPIGVTVSEDGDTLAAFPVARMLQKPIDRVEVAEAVAGVGRGRPGRATVMVIDDDPAARELMRATLAGMDLDVVCMADGRVALEQLDRHRPDAIVLDLIMPDFDGFAVLDALHRSPRWSRVPVFVWTNMILTDDEYRGLGRSARAVLVKGGAHPTALIGRIEDWCAERDADEGAP